MGYPNRPKATTKVWRDSELPPKTLATVQELRAEGRQVEVRGKGKIIYVLLDGILRDGAMWVQVRRTKTKAALTVVN